MTLMCKERVKKRIFHTNWLAGVSRGPMAGVSAGMENSIFFNTFLMYMELKCPEAIFMFGNIFPNNETSFTH